MAPFTGQLTRLGLNGLQAIVWPIRPYYIKAFFTLRDRAKAFLGVSVG